MKVSVARSCRSVNAFIRISILILVGMITVGLMRVGAVEVQNLPPGTNIDEAKAGTYTLPDAIICSDDKRVVCSRTLAGDYRVMAQFMEKHLTANTVDRMKQAGADQPKLQFIKSNGIRMRIAEMGKGPLVILVHGWPESWYSWRHQLPALAAAGYRAVAPDMRGYGKSDKPQAVEDYDIQHLTADLSGIVDALGEKEAILIGHDWGAIVSWQAMLLYPQRFKALVAMSVPYSGRGSQSIIQGLRRTMGENFHYILYFQEPGIAEKEFDTDPRTILSRLYLSPDSPREAPEVTDPKMAAGGWIPRLGAPKGLPSWLTQADLDYYVAEFREAGFRGGINYYRNFHRNWETTPHLADVKITAPVLFIAGDKDVVIRGATAEALTASMKNAVPGLRGVTLIANTGHWVQQERPAATNEAILQFLKGLGK